MLRCMARRYQGGGLTLLESCRGCCWSRYDTKPEIGEENRASLMTLLDESRMYDLYIYIYISLCVCVCVCVCYRLIGLVGRVFANGSGDLGSIPGRVIPKTLKMVIDTYLLNTQQYKVRIKGKVEKSWERNSALPYTSV